MRFITQATVAVLAIGGAVASPAPKIVKRSLFDFSQWDNNQPNAAAHKEKLTKGFQDAIELARRVHKKEDAGKWDAIYKNYFQGDDQPNVEDVFRGIVGGTDDQPDGKPDGSSYFERVVVINFKFDDSDTECENNDKVLGWFENLVQGEPNRGVMRICPKALDNYPLQDGTKCEDLDAEVSGKMSTLGGVILHEMTHFDAIGKIATGIHITDYGDAGYGPMNTRSFNKDSNVPVSNADQYRWFAQEYHWTLQCKKDFAAPKSNWDYIKCKEGESNCIIM